jgi:V8-like Glu-specific endopeptidase
MRKLSLWSAALALAGMSMAASAQLPGTAANTPFLQSDLASGKSIPGYTAPETKSVEDRAQRMARLHAWLSSEHVTSKSGGIRVQLSRQERFQIGEITECAECAPVEASERRKLVGISKPVGLTVDLSGFASKRKIDGLRRTSDGGFAWTTPVHSEGAMALRVAFSGLDLPVGAELYVYNAAGEAYGPYTGRGIARGELVSNTVTGDTAFVQLRMLGTPTAADMAKLRFTIAEVGHIGPEFELARRLNNAMAGEKAFCDYNASCVINGECASWTHLSNTRAAIAHMLFRSGGGYYICSGGLLNNSNNDGTPLFLTANHCIGRSREAESLETFFDFRATSCGDEGWCNYSSYDELRANFPSSLGATLLASGTSGDFSLMQLSSAPSGRHFMGWSTTPIATNFGADLFRLSHPQGSPQAWSTHDVDGEFQCGTLPRGSFIYSRDSAGATQGGSSGSPVLNASGLVVGQLYGACGSNLNDECDAQNNLTVDGALAHYFPNVSAWLDPSGGGGDPGDPGDVTASVASVTVSTSSKGPWTHYTASVVVVDQSGNPVANATVSGSWSGAVSGSGSAVTDGSGTATVTGAKSRGGGSAQFCVTGVAGSGITFDGTSVCDSGG